MYCILFRGDSLTRMPVTTTTTCWALISEPAAPYVQVVETPQKLKVLLRGGQVMGWDSQCGVVSFLDFFFQQFLGKSTDLHCSSVCASVLSMFRLVTLIPWGQVLLDVEDDTRTSGPPLQLLNMDLKTTSVAVKVGWLKHCCCCCCCSGLCGWLRLGNRRHWAIGVECFI